MDELLIRVLTRLLRIHDEFGENSFQQAAHKALVAIARAAKDEAEIRAGSNPSPAFGAVISFPLAKAREDRSDDASNR